MPKESSIGVSLYSCARTALGLKPFFSSMTSRMPCLRSERSMTFEMPTSFLPVTASLIFSMTFSGPTPYGSSVTTRPVLRGPSCSMSTMARVLKEPRPVR